jgi:hypothetical protein
MFLPIKVGLYFFKDVRLWIKELNNVLKVYQLNLMTLGTHQSWQEVCVLLVGSSPLLLEHGLLQNPLAFQF